MLARDVFTNAGKPVATVLKDGELQRLRLRFLLFGLSLQSLHLGIFAAPVVIQRLQTLVQQRQLLPRKPGLEGFTASTQHIRLGRQVSIAVAIGHQGVKQLHLLLGLQHGSVGAVQVVKMRQQTGDSRGHVKRLQHVVAHKIGQVTDRFHRHGLVKQVQRLLTQIAEAAPKVRAVGRKAVKQRHAAFAQTRAQRGHGGAEV